MGKPSLRNRYNISKGDFETLSVIDYQFFKYYRANNKLRNPDNTPHYVATGKILSLFYRKIGERMVQSSGGVFIKGLGYFGAVLDSKRDYTFLDKACINKETNGYKYHLIFIPISRDSILRTWVADGSFTPKIKSAFSKSIKSGMKYTLNFLSFFQKYSGRRQKSLY